MCMNFNVGVLFCSFAFVWTFDERIITLNTMLAQSGWQLLRDVKIVEGDRLLTIDELLEATFEGLTVTDYNFKPRLRQISIILSCKYGQKLRELAAIVRRLATSCRDEQRFSESLKILERMQTAIIETIVGADSMVTHMMNALSFLYQLSPSYTESRPIYASLTSLVLYADYKIRNRPKYYTFGDRSDIENEVDEVIKILLSVDNRVEAFVVERCWLADVPVTKWIASRLQHSSARDKQQPPVNLSADDFGTLAEEVIEDYYHELGFEYYVPNDSRNVTVFTDLNVIWHVLASGQSRASSPATVLWFDRWERVAVVVQDIKSRYRASYLAAFQVLSLKAIMEMLYKKTREALESMEFAGMAKENVPSFWMALRKVLLKLRFIDLPNDLDDTLTTLDEFVNTAILLNSFDGTSKGVIELLVALERDMNDADFADPRVSIGNAFERVDAMDRFVDEVLTVDKQIKNVIRDVTLQWNAADYERTYLWENSLRNPLKVNDDELASITPTVCHLLTDMIEFFAHSEALIYKSVNLQGSEFLTFFYLTTIGKALWSVFSGLSARVFYRLNKAPKFEDVNVRNAMVLTLLYLNLAGQDELGTGSEELPKSPRGPRDFAAIGWKRFVRLNVLITNQLERYAINNCHVRRSRITIVDELKANSSLDANALIYKCKTILKAMHNPTDNAMLDNCHVDLENASYGALVSSRKLNNSLSCMDTIEFLWNGQYVTINQVRVRVLADINPTVFAKYQVMVLHVITSIIFGYILNILETLKSVTLNLNFHHTSQILLKIDKFDRNVYPVSKIDSPRHVFKLVHWWLASVEFSIVKADILMTAIKKKLKSYGINLKPYKKILRKHNILHDNNKDIYKDFINPLAEYVDNLLNRHTRELIYSVAEYMTLRL